MIHGKTHRIQINNVSQFSIGDTKAEGSATASGPPIIWAKGPAGWFELTPETIYEAVHNDMNEAVKLYFFFVDLYTEAEEKRRIGRNARIDMKAIMHAYAENVGPQDITEEKILANLDKHAEFLIPQMRKDTSLVAWNKKAIYEYLKSRWPAIVKKTLASAAIPIKPTALPPNRAVAFSAEKRRQTALKDHQKQAQPEPEPPVGGTSPGLDNGVATTPTASEVLRPSKSGKGAGKNAILRTPGRPAPQLEQESSEPSDEDEDEEQDPTLNSDTHLKMEDDAEDDSMQRTADDTKDDLERADPSGDLGSTRHREPATKLETKHETHFERNYQDSDYTHEYIVPKVELEVVAERLSSMNPTGLKGTWVCEQADCDYQVPAAGTTKGRAAIRAHFLEHADEHAIREDLVFEEGFRVNVPVSHLIDKIRRVGEAKRKQEHEDRKVINGRIVPLPLKRKFDF